MSLAKNIDFQAPEVCQQLQMNPQKLYHHEKIPIYPLCGEKVRENANFGPKWSISNFYTYHN